MAPTSLPDNASLVLAPPIIGVTLNWWLYGILVMQYLIYLNNIYARDRKALQAVVHFLFVLDTVQTFMIMDDVFFWFVRNFGNYSALFEFHLAAVDGPIVDAVITFTVQLVYCWRLWKIGNWKVFPVFIATLSLASCIGGMVEGIHGTMTFTHEKAAVYLWLLATAFTDTMIAGSMTYLLLTYRKSMKSETMLSIVKRVVLLTLETNAVTAAVAIVLVMTLLVPSIRSPNTNLSMVFGYTLGKMYSNCFMVLLNQRVYYDTPEENGRFISASCHAPGTSSCNHSPAQVTMGRISEIRFTETSSDDGPQTRGLK